MPSAVTCDHRLGLRQGAPAAAGLGVPMDAARWTVSANGVRLIVAVSLALTLTAAPVAAALATLPVHLAWTWNDFTRESLEATGGGGFYNIDSRITVEAHDPSAQLYFARQFSFVDNNGLGGGYLGLQSNGVVGGQTVPKSLIFSIWDADEARAATDGGSTCQAFGHQGDGFSCQRQFDWQVGRTYVLRVWTVSDGWWGAWLIDEETGEEVQIGTIHIPPGRRWLDTTAVFFTEVFGSGSIECEDLPYSRVRLSAPTANAGTVQAPGPPNTFGVSADDFPGASGCLDYARGWNEGQTAYHEVGLANSPDDVMAQTITYLHRVALDRPPTTQELESGLGRLSDRCVDGYRALAEDLLLGAEFEQHHASTSGAAKADVLLKAALHRRATEAEESEFATTPWRAAVDGVLSSTEFAERTSGLCGAGGAAEEPAGPGAGSMRPDTERLAGVDRLSTAAVIARAAFPDRADSVYLARADVFADALAAGVLSDGPVLLVPSCGEVPAVVADAIARLDPDEVVGLGGGAAVCDDLLAAAGEGRDVGRLAGSSRTATAAAIAQRAFPDGAAEVYLASAGDSPDAVAGGGLVGGPILLTGPDGPDAATADGINQAGAGRVVALGGTAAVSQAALDAAAGAREQLRVAGADRIATAVAISRFGFAPTDGPASSAVRPATTVYLARADVFADAVAGGVLTGGPTLLVPSCGTLPSQVGDRIAEVTPDRIVALGGPSAICDDLLTQAAEG